MILDSIECNLSLKIFINGRYYSNIDKYDRSLNIKTLYLIIEVRSDDYCILRPIRISDMTHSYEPTMLDLPNLNVY